MSLPRRTFLTASAAAIATGGRPRPARAQAPRPITAAHSVSTFVYGPHLVAREKKLFEEEGAAQAKLS